MSKRVVHRLNFDNPSEHECYAIPQPDCNCTEDWRKVTCKRCLKLRRRK